MATARVASGQQANCEGNDGDYEMMHGSQSSRSRRNSTIHPLAKTSCHHSERGIGRDSIRDISTSDAENEQVAMHGMTCGSGSSSSRNTVITPTDDPVEDVEEEEGNAFDNGQYPQVGNYLIATLTNLASPSSILNSYGRPSIDNVVHGDVRPLSVSDASQSDDEDINDTACSTYPGPSPDSSEVIILLLLLNVFLTMLSGTC